MPRIIANAAREPNPFSSPRSGQCPTRARRWRGRRASSHAAASSPGLGSSQPWRSAVRRAVRIRSIDSGSRPGRKGNAGCGGRADRRPPRRGGPTPRGPRCGGGQRPGSVTQARMTRRDGAGLRPSPSAPSATGAGIGRAMFPAEVVQVRHALHIRAGRADLLVELQRLSLMPRTRCIACRAVSGDRGRSWCSPAVCRRSRLGSCGPCVGSAAALRPRRRVARPTGRVRRTATAIPTTRTLSWEDTLGDAGLPGTRLSGTV